MNAEYNFTGAARTRTINLGGPRGASAAQLAASARAERALRQAERDRARSATHVQAVWRGRTEARRVRAERVREFVAQQHVVQRHSAELSSSADRQLAHVRWLRLLCAAKGAPEEGQLLRVWSQTMLNDEALFDLYASPHAASWRTLVGLAVRRMLVRLGSAAPSAERNAESLAALALLLRMCKPSAAPAGGQASFATQFAQSLMADSLYPALHAHLVSFPVDRKASPTLQPAIDLSLVPVTLQLPGALQAFVLHVLAVPNLPARVPLASLARLAADLPLLDVLRCIDPVPSTPHLLANLVALSARRVPQLKNATELSTYLDTLSQMQDALPRSTFEGALEGTAGSTAVPDEHLEKASSSRAATDAATHKRLSGLVAPSHLSALMTASTKFSSSRPALTRFLVSTLEAWPASARDRVFSATLFGSGPPNGLVRELWRGWVRGGPLAKAIGLAGHGGAGGARAAVATIDSAELAEGWGPLLLLVELYSRVLLTLGDDEFRPPASAPGTSSSTPSRNPLTLDEIVTFSALLRTMSFSLYWLEGSSGLPDLSTRVPGFRLTRMELRSLFTTLLRQIHARDARKRFAPEGHWLMTSEMDLNSFIQTVMLEEDELAEPLSNAAPAEDEGMEDEFDEFDEILPVSSRLQALRRTQEAGSSLNARQMAFLSPRLGVLNNIPFTIPFELRVEIFRQFIYRDHERRKRAGLRVRHTRTVRIRRSEVAHDGFLALNPLGAALKDRVLIEFIDDWGNVEAGIDGGGLFKEFLTSLITQAFDTNRGLWLATEQQELYPNPHAYAREPEQLEWYKFLGRVLGKALYMGILVDIKFARFFLSKWLGRQGYLDDLASLDSLDPVMYRGLLYLKNYDGDVEADLALNFTVQSDELGHVTSHDLIPGGSNIPVTRENRLSYIYRVSHYRLTGQISRQCDAFFSGLSDIIDPRWLRILDVDELKVLVCGTEEPIDLTDLRANTELGGYDDKDEAIEHFWAALHTFTPNERRAMLKFVTSCPSPPLLGFSELRPKFGIRQAGNDATRLPTASTCVNLLKLPRYTSVAQTREKLLYAINSGAGFDLS